MAKSKGLCSDESFKLETVYTLEKNKSVAQVARETGENTNTLHNCVK